jgi:hypothetical protein
LIPQLHATSNNQVSPKKKQSWKRKFIVFRFNFFLIGKWYKNGKLAAEKERKLLGINFDSISRGFYAFFISWMLKKKEIRIE